MKRSFAWVVISIIAATLIAAVIYVALRPKTQPEPTKLTTTTTTATSPETPPPTTPGQYTAYTADSLANAKGRRVLFFHASWCPQCRAIEQDILAKGVPNGMTILKVDYDTNQALKQKYAITMQTTVVEIDQQGNTVKKHVAYNEPSLDAILKAIGQ